MKKEKIICKEKIAIDFQNGKELLKDLENNVTIFGSARTLEDEKYALLAQKLAYNLAKNNISDIVDGKAFMFVKGAYENVVEYFNTYTNLPSDYVDNELENQKEFANIFTH